MPSAAPDASAANVGSTNVGPAATNANDPNQLSSGPEASTRSASPATSVSPPTGSVQLAQAIPPLIFFEEPPVLIRPPLPEFPQDPSVPPSGYVWRGQPGSQPGGPNGNYYNPQTQETLRPDLQHEPPLGPHWDYRAPDRGPWYRWFPDGRVELKT